jgi:hypothetical protein
MSEKMLEIDFQAGTPILAGDPFGMGRKPYKTAPQEKATFNPRIN